ncbi:metallophosphoesterase [Halomicronema sp. CCY15110]|uniref:metallophosphoesterase n=1 Tax=Halomicronema sp. CCY15110 TaxID=2767773 RepID=UPI001EF2C84E|nr:metallophosphoesterase [Halomicronema sp. CCY15110]
MLPPILIEPLKIEHVTVAIANLPERLQGMIVVQLSDFHFDGRSLALKVLREAIARCHDLAPDLIVLTGDFITDEAQDIDGLTPYLQELHSPNGIYAILGNHDNFYPHSRSRVTAGLESVGIHTLWNDIACPLGVDFPLVGLADFYSRDFVPATIFQQLDPQLPRLVLSHNPDSVVALQQYRADLVLSGHTHGGQVILPWGPAPALLQQWGAVVPKWMRPFLPFLKQDCDRIFRNWQWSAGLHQVGATQLYVNRGLGSYFPGRWRCPPELTVIHLVGEP